MSPFDLMAWAGAVIVVCIALFVLMFAVQALRIMAQVNIVKKAEDVAEELAPKKPHVPVYRER